MLDRLPASTLPLRERPGRPLPRRRGRAATLALALALAAGGGALAHLAAPSPARADGLADAFAARVRAFELPNGLRLIVLRRGEVPVFSAVTMVNAGSVDEHVGITGVAHVFEHMAFKGSRTIGTTDFAKEQEALRQLDETFEALKRERAKGGGRMEQVVRLRKAFEKRQAEAQAFVVNNEYSVIVERNGGAGLNASTGYDTTQYFVNFPANRLELWFCLEADRFREPVLREFYKEKEVVLEERRMRTESSPIGKLIEEFLAVAYKAHPYGYPTVGHASDMETLTTAEAAAFFRRHYVPNNMVIALVGDIDPDEAHRFAQKYFGDLPRGPHAEPVETVEPEQEGEKRVTVESPAQAMVGVGFHKPSALHPDEPTWQVISMLLSDGRTSRLYKRLVTEQQSALQAGGFTGFPGEKYPNLFILYALPTVGHEAAELEQALIAEADRLKTEPVAEVELKRVKTRARARLIEGLASNEGLALGLASAATLYGDWKEAFRILERIDAVTPDDIQRVARATFTKKNRIVGTIVKPESGSESGSGSEPEAGSGEGE